MARKIVVCGPCWGHVSGDFGEDDCCCPEHDNADPDVVGYPPFHKGCVCYVVDEMREHRFQAWDIKEKKMYECAWVGPFECMVLVPNSDPGRLFSDRIIKDWKPTPINAEPEVIIREYIGHSDMDGNKLFEYDVVKNGNYHAIIEWGFNGWSPFEYCGGGEMDVRSVQRVGNILENSELKGLVRT